MKNTVGLLGNVVECLFLFFLRLVAMNLKILWLAKIYIFSATFSSSDAKIERVDSWIRVLLDKNDKERKARIPEIDTGKSLS